MHEKAYVYPANSIKAIQSILDNREDDSSFIDVLEMIYASEKKVLREDLLKTAYNISSGTSELPTFGYYIEKLNSTMSKHVHYMQYSSPAGSQTLRRAIAKYENKGGFCSTIYDKDSVCVTEGATGAISSVIEYISKTFPKGEILIPAPSYYLFKFSAKFNSVRYSEVYPDFRKEQRFISGKNIVNNIKPETKLIVLTHPNNPTGEIYSEEELSNILEIAKKKEIMVVSDEVFSDLILTEDFNRVDRIASRVGALNNVVTIKSLSKGKNLPGLRIGYALSTNIDVIKYCAKANENRVFFATGSNFQELIISDCFYKSVFAHKKMDKISNVKSAVKEMQIYYKDIEYIQKKSIEELQKEYTNYIQYLRDSKCFYRHSFSEAMDILVKETEYIVNPLSAFNAFVKIKNMNGINMLDFCINLYVCTGIKLAIGPYFGLSQSEWEQKESLGFWVRITFASQRDIFKQALREFIAFKKYYISHPENFYSSGLRL